MTRLEATSILHGIRADNLNLDDLYTKDKYDALGMAIKALEQAPCEDAISRQAVQDYIAKYLSQYLYNDVREAVEVIDEYIGELPSVNPQSKTGYWIGIDEEPHEDYKCSCCGYVVSTFTANIEPHTEYKYCPHCGARME